MDPFTVGSIIDNKKHFNKYLIRIRLVLTYNIKKISLPYTIIL